MLLGCCLEDEGVNKQVFPASDASIPSIIGHQRIVPYTSRSPAPPNVSTSPVSSPGCPHKKILNALLDGFHQPSCVSEGEDAWGWATGCRKE